MSLNHCTRLLRGAGKALSWIALVLGLVVLAGCEPRPILDRHWPDTYWRDGPYSLGEVDTEAQMSLRLDAERPLVDVLVPGTVYAVGADARFVVVKQHPSDGFGWFDVNVTNYFIVDRAVPIEEQARQHKGVRGPMNRQEFDNLARHLNLPAFTKRFSKLDGKVTGE